MQSVVHGWWRRKIIFCAGMAVGSWMTLGMAKAIAMNKYEDLKKEELTSEKARRRNMSVQAQTSYTWWRATPRFTPLAELQHGCWEQ